MGFEDSFLPDQAVIPAINLSLKRIFNDLGVTDTAKIYAEPIVPLTFVDKIRHFGKSSESYPLNGAAWSFTVSGKGSYTVTDGGITRRYSFDSSGEVRRGFISLGGRITFEGDFSYTVFGLATFDNSFGDALSSIPVVSDRREFNLREIRPDFLSLASYPRDSSGAEVRDARVGDGIISLPSEFEGEIICRYRRAPRLLTADSLDGETVDVPPSAEAILPLLAASLLWLADEPERAEYYKRLYDESIAGILAQGRISADPTVRVNGWA